GCTTINHQLDPYKLKRAKTGRREHKSTADRRELRRNERKPARRGRRHSGCARVYIIGLRRDRKGNDNNQKNRQRTKCITKHKSRLGWFHINPLCAEAT